MARKPQPLKGDSLTARIINLTCHHKAKRLGIEEYTIAQLSHDSRLNHSIILRAVAAHPKEGPTRETVKRLADALEVALDSELEDHFWNAFGYASPRQLAAAQSYVEQVEQQEKEAET